MAFVLISRIYRLMYADTGIATDSARVTWSGRWARGWPSLPAPVAEVSHARFGCASDRLARDGAGGSGCAQGSDTIRV